MSIDGAWDLRSTATPKSLCVFPAPLETVSPTTPSSYKESRNPFDEASANQQLLNQNDSPPHAVIIGTEKGSLHYRCYPSVPTEYASDLHPPLGIGTDAKFSSVPRSYQPVNLNNAAPGSSIVSILPLSNNVFLLLLDDNVGPTASQPGVYGTMMVTLRQSTFVPIHSSFNSSMSPTKLPRMSCATYSSHTGLVYGAGRTIANLTPDLWGGLLASNMTNWQVSNHLIPAPGVRSGPDAMAVSQHSNNVVVVVVAVSSDFYAVYPNTGEGGNGVVLKMVSFAYSQIHPVLIHAIPDESLQQRPEWSSFFLASGRDCAVVDWHKDAMTAKTRHAPTSSVASPILAAACPWPWIVLLTSDGLLSIRSPSCLAIPLRTVEVGNRPNDYFTIQSLLFHESSGLAQRTLCSISYSGEGRVLKCLPDTAQDLADRLMRLSIDAFGANSFPRSELAEAVNASFTATSYVGPEPTAHARALLQQYLEALLGLADFDSGAASKWPTEGEGYKGGVFEDQRARAGRPDSAISLQSKISVVCASALLCLVCANVSPSPNASMANRAAKAAAEKAGVVFQLPTAAVAVCEIVVDKLLREASQSFSLLNTSNASKHRSQASTHAQMVESCVWLLRACGQHERALTTLHERLHPQNASATWSQIKFESYRATHLSELWMSKQDEGCRLVLENPATSELLENNPTLGLAVFTSTHPTRQSEWDQLSPRDDPLVHPTYPFRVVERLKATLPAVPYNSQDENSKVPEDGPLPLETGRALAVSYLESAIGISTGRRPDRSPFPPEEDVAQRISNLNNELAYLLLEGIIVERGDDDKDEDTPLGLLYRNKFRRLLRWPVAKIDSERLLTAMPNSFLEEKALLLGRLGRHKDALRILYCDLGSLDLAIAYCDNRYKEDPAGAYLPLVKVALESDQQNGTKAAIQVLAMRSGSIDRAAALRMLPETVPVSAVARPFLIPALVDSASEVRRLTVTAALLRAKYLALKQKLTNAQLKAQSSLSTIPQLRFLGEPLHSTKPVKARPSNLASATLPEVMIVKHFFPRHLVIQAITTNNSEGVDERALGEVAFVIAESSDEALQTGSQQLSIPLLPFGRTGSAWCVLSAAPARMDSVAILTCELRYAVLTVDVTTGAPLSFGNTSRLFVEELQDMEVHAGHFQ